jgi:ubiquinone/menaquinone biosynthesis C-methylase UbiE
MPIAFDALSYDSQFTHTQIGAIQRGLVWKYLLKMKKELPGKNVLELNCGTGEDAVFLASIGLSVLATDFSPEMLSVASKKISKQKLTERVSLARLDLNQISDFKTDQKFDFIFSNFAGLNCLDEDHFKNVLKCCDQWLNPGGRLVVVLFSTTCLWESLYFFLKFEWRNVFRRHSSPVEFNGLKIWYYSPSQVTQLSPDTLRLKNQIPIGLFTPPNYLESAFKSKRVLLRIFKFLDSAFPFSFLSRFADHYLLDLRKP